MPASKKSRGLSVLAPLFAASALAVEGPNPPVQPLGTLLYSAAERNSITRARQGEPAVGAASNVLTVSGIVKRERGNSTVWINGQPVREGQSLPPTSRISISATGATLDSQRVRVGETVDINTHELSDIVPPGAVTIKSKR